MTEYEYLVARFGKNYVDTMLHLEKMKCEHCGVSLGAHAARFVSEACRSRREETT